MRNWKILNSESRQLWWVVLLLVASVILPTVCLLWFVNVAVKNLQLAVRQKLVNFYTGEAKKSFVEYADNYWSKDREKFANSDKSMPADFFKDFVLADNSVYGGLIIYDSNGSLIYPVLSIQQSLPESIPALENIWAIEYIEKDYIKAADSYGKLADGNDTALRTEALAGRARCLKKAGRLADAAADYERLGWAEDFKGINDGLSADARLMQIRLYQATADPNFFKSIEKIFENSFSDLQIDTAKKIFLLTECVKVAEKAGIADRLRGSVEKVQRQIKAEKLSLAVAETFPSVYPSGDWRESTFKKLDIEPAAYGVNFAAKTAKIIAMVDANDMKTFWAKAAGQIEDETVFCRLLDDTGRIIAGRSKEDEDTEIFAGQQFLSQNLGEFFPGWKIELYFWGGVFTKTAEQQRLVYFWTLTLVIASMIAVSALLTRSILQQAKLNKLKNNFIATITHELKTPLSSMRVLVDTLLEGRYEGQQQITEYLQLVSKENKRLSRLIDNFLTFSRMERNKQAFDIKPASPSDIANAAADAVQTKLNKGNCKFILTVDENLPSILADKDAMVTVLVNLLDNAYKYSYDNKEIELKLYWENGQVCFSVKDNGIGMSKRVVKKIFNKFYQADSSLSRRAQGTGLGLSIVKFIVEAHKGKILVETKPGGGSNFTVKIPISA